MSHHRVTSCDKMNQTYLQCDILPLCPRSPPNHTSNLVATSHHFDDQISPPIYTRYPIQPPMLHHRVTWHDLPRHTTTQVSPLCDLIVWLNIPEHNYQPCDTTISPASPTNYTRYSQQLSMWLHRVTCYPRVTKSEAPGPPPCNIPRPPSLQLPYVTLSCYKTPSHSQSTRKCCYLPPHRFCPIENY